MSLFSVTFLPGNQRVRVFAGQTLLDAALQAGVALDHVCGGSCACATCHVVIKEGFELLEEPTDDELERLGEVGGQLQKTSRLACQTEIRSDLVVQIN